MLKKKIKEQLVLVLPNFYKPFQVNTDANNDAIREGLIKEDNVGH